MKSTLTGNEYKLPEIFSNNSVDTYHRCPRKFQYSALERLVPAHMNWAAQFGVAVHEALAAWYRTQNDDQEQLLKKILIAMRDLKPTDEVSVIKPDMSAFQLRTELSLLIGQAALPAPDDANAGDHRNDRLLEQIIRNYTHLYRHEPFRVIHVEKNFILTMSYNVLYQGILDLIVLWAMTGKVVTMDHKTTSSIYKFGDKFTPGHQMTGYILGCKTFMDDVADEACINGIMTARRKEGIRPDDFQRFPNVHRADEELAEFMNNTVATVERMHGDLDRGYFPMHTASCNDFGGCPYKNVCSAPPQNRDSILRNSFVKRADARDRGLEEYTNKTVEKSSIKITRNEQVFEIDIEASHVPTMSWHGNRSHYDKDSRIWVPGDVPDWVNHRAFLDGVEVSSWLSDEEKQEASKTLTETREKRLQEIADARAEDVDL
jgi:hypothetical protein